MVFNFSLIIIDILKIESDYMNTELIMDNSLYCEENSLFFTVKNNVS